MIVAGENVAKFVSDSLGVGLCPPYTAIGIERDGKVTAGVIFNVFEEVDVHVTVAGKGWTPNFMRAVGDYVFGALDLQRMTIVTEHAKIAELAVRLGGQIEGRLRNHFGVDRDGIVAGILRDEYRFWKPC